MYEYEDGSDADAKKKVDEKNAKLQKTYEALLKLSTDCLAPVGGAYTIIIIAIVGAALGVGAIGFYCHGKGRDCRAANHRQRAGATTSRKRVCPDA